MEVEGIHFNVFSFHSEKWNGRATHRRRREAAPPKGGGDRSDGEKAPPRKRRRRRRRSPLFLGGVAFLLLHPGG